MAFWFLRTLFMHQICRLVHTFSGVSLSGRVGCSWLLFQSVSDHAGISPVWHCPVKFTPAEAEAAPWVRASPSVCCSSESVLLSCACVALFEVHALSLWHFGTSLLFLCVCVIFLLVCNGNGRGTDPCLLYLPVGHTVESLRSSS